MLALENKIEELESQGLSKKEIELQTQDLFNQLLNEELEEEKSYLADINLTIKIDSKMKIEKLQSVLDEPRVKKLLLELADQLELKTEVLDAELIEVEEWDNL